MGLASDAAVAAAERIERAGGAAAGLAVWRRLAEGATSADLRARATLGGVRCASALRDDTALFALARTWESVEAGIWIDAVVAACKGLARAGLRSAAEALAAAEARRAPTARSLYLLARCLDVADDPRAPAAFADAITRAEREGADAIANAARVRRASWLARSREGIAEAVAEASRVDPAAVEPRARIALAAVLLSSPSRFVRAGAIDALDTVLASDDPSLISRAVRLAARHVDTREDALSSLETDRLRALFGRPQVAKWTERARAVLEVVERIARARDDAELDAALAQSAALDPTLAAQHARARDILAGRFEPHAAPAHGAGVSLLDLAAALRDGEAARASIVLRALAEATARGEPASPRAWTLAQAALAAEAEGVRDAATRLVAALLESRVGPPPRGWLPLAIGLASVGADELATAARRAAAFAREAGAPEAHALALTRSGWALAREGERARALARLREARAIALAHRRPGAPPAAAHGEPPSRSRR